MPLLLSPWTLHLPFFLFPFPAVRSRVLERKANLAQWETPTQLHCTHPFPVSAPLFSLLPCLIICLKSYTLFVSLFTALHFSFSAFSLLPESIWQYETWPLTLAEIPEMFVVFISEQTHTRAGAGRRARTHTHTFVHTCTNPKCYFQWLWSWRKTGAYWDEAWGLGGDNVGMIVCPASLLFPETLQKLNPTSDHN